MWSSTESINNSIRYILCIQMWIFVYIEITSSSFKDIRVHNTRADTLRNNEFILQRGYLLTYLLGS